MCVRTLSVCVPSACTVCLFFLFFFALSLSIRRVEEGAGKVIEKGMLRFLILVLDMSSCMELTDLKPTRRLLLTKLVEGFIKEYFDQNPLSQLGMLACYNKVAEKITELSGLSICRLHARFALLSEHF